MNRRDRKSNATVYVSGNLDRAIRQLKKKMEKEGVVRDTKRLAHHEKPTTKRRRRYLRSVKQAALRQLHTRGA